MNIPASDKNEWKQVESVNGDAIIAIDESTNGHMIVMLTSDSDKVNIQAKYDVLPELEYTGVLPGLYYADMKVRQVYDKFTTRLK